MIVWQTKLTRIWYHYEEWQSGDRISKKSKYIPQKMRSSKELQSELAKMKKKR